MRLMVSSVLSLVAASAATASKAGDELTLATTVGFESRYVFRGVQFAETSFQPAINVGYGNFYGFAWANLPIGDDDLVVTPGGEELDLVVGYSAPLNEVVTLDAGLTYYVFPDVASGLFDLFEEDGDGMGANTLEPFIGASFATFLSPSIYLYRDFNLDTFTIQIAGAHAFPIDDKWSVNVGGFVGYVIDDDPGGDYLYGVASADIAYAFSDKSAVSVGARYGGSDIAGGSLIDDSIAGTTKASGFWWGLSFSSTF